jgi:hypothetical protein
VSAVEYSSLAFHCSRIFLSICILVFSSSEILRFYVPLSDFVEE